MAVPLKLKAFALAWIAFLICCGQVARADTDGWFAAVADVEEVTLVDGWAAQLRVPTEGLAVAERITPPLRVWTGPRPAYYGPGSECSPDEASIVARAMWDVGAYDSEVERMLGVISRESGCDSSAVNMNSRTRDASHGLCQQNSLAGWFDPGQLLGHIDRWAFPHDFHLNAYSCALMWSRCDFLPWRYQNYGCQRPR